MGLPAEAGGSDSIVMMFIRDNWQRRDNMFSCQCGEGPLVSSYNIQLGLLLNSELLFIPHKTKYYLTLSNSD